MSYDEKVEILTERLRGIVKFGRISQAKEYRDVHKKSRDDPAWQSLCGCAEKILLFQEQLGLSDVLTQIGQCDGTRLSALRDAIRQIAVEEIDRRQAKPEKERNCEPLPDVVLIR